MPTTPVKSEDKLKPGNKIPAKNPEADVGMNMTIDAGLTCTRV